MVILLLSRILIKFPLSFPKLIYVGEYTKAMGKLWHLDHFCCWQCDMPLTGKKYISINNQPFCITCYNNIIANRYGGILCFLSPLDEWRFIYWWKEHNIACLWMNISDGESHAVFVIIRNKSLSLSTKIVFVCSPLCFLPIQVFPIKLTSPSNYVLSLNIKRE